MRADTTRRERWTQKATSMTKVCRVLTVYFVKNTYTERCEWKLHIFQAPKISHYFRLLH